MNKKIQYKTEQVTKNKSVNSDCRSIKFEIKTGSADCYIDNDPLIIGQPRIFNCYPGEINTTVYKVRFSGAGTTLLYITREIEID